MANSDYTGVAKAAVLAREKGQLAPLVDALPYARLLGIEAVTEPPSLVFKMPNRHSNMGNPTLPALHGGAVGGFMEMSAALHLLMTMETLKVPRVVDFSIDYVRAGRMEDSFCECEVVRQGKRLVNVAVKAWQSDPLVPIATARAHFLVD